MRQNLSVCDYFASLRGQGRHEKEPISKSFHLTSKCTEKFAR